MKNYIVSSNRMFQDFLQKDRLKNGRTELYAGDVSIKTVTYTDGYSLDIYRPKNAPDNEPLPVIVDIHGGGYIACSKETNIMQSRWFAKNGYCTVTPDYPLLPENTIPQALRCIFKVLEFIKNNAQQYGFDTDNVFMTGDSSGAHMTLIAAALQNSMELRAQYGISSDAVRIKRFAVTCPVGSAGLLTGILRPVLGKHASDEIKYFRSISLSDLVSQCSYPDIFILTSEDDIGIHYETLHLHLLLNAANIFHFYKCYKGSTHKLEHVWNVLFPEWDESQEANGDILRFFETGKPE